MWSLLRKIRPHAPVSAAPSSADVAIARACDERDRWIVNPASLWTASGPQSGSPAVHMLEVRQQTLRAGAAPPVCHLFLLF
jgi:hypothetical protein